MLLFEEATICKISYLGLNIIILVISLIKKN